MTMLFLLGLLLLGVLIWAGIRTDGRLPRRRSMSGSGGADVDSMSMWASSDSASSDSSPECSSSDGSGFDGGSNCGSTSD